VTAIIIVEDRHRYGQHLSIYRSLLVRECLAGRLARVARCRVHALRGADNDVASRPTLVLVRRVVLLVLEERDGRVTTRTHVSKPSQ
jgi:hypothetical protein